MIEIGGGVLLTFVESKFFKASSHRFSGLLINFEAVLRPQEEQLWLGCPPLLVKNLKISLRKRTEKIT